MKIKLVLLAACCLVSAGFGQWLEKTVRLPDSLGGLESPSSFCVNTGNNTIFVGGGGDRVIVMDGVTNRRVAGVTVPGGAERMCYNPAQNRVCAINRSRPFVYVIDAASNVLADSVYVDDDLVDVCYVPTVNKLYCGSEGARTVTAIDCTADTVTGVALVGGYYELRLCPAPAENKVYCGFYSSDEDNLVVLDCTTDTVVGSVHFVDVDISDIAYNPVANKLYVAWGSFGEVIIVDCATDSVLTWTSVGEGYGSLAVDATDNKVYVSCYRDDRVDAISGVTNAVVGSVTVPGVRDVAWDATENLLVGLDVEIGRLVTIDCASDTLAGFLSIPGYPSGLGWNPVQGRALVAVEDDVVVVEPSPLELMARVPMWFDIGELCMDPDDNLLYTAGGNELAVIELQANRVRSFVTLPATAGPLFYHPDRRRVYCATDSGVVMVDCAGDSILGVVPRTGSVDMLCYNPVRNKLYARETNYLRVIDCAQDTVVATLQIYYAEDIVYSAQSDRLFCMDGNGAIRIIDGATDALIATIPLARGDHDLCYVPDGDLLACSNREYATVDLIDCASGWVYASAQLYYDPYRLAYSNHSRKLYSFEYTGGHVTILDVPSMQAAGEMWLTGRVVSVSYDSLSDRLACGLNQAVPAVRFIDCGSDSFVAHIPVPGSPVSMVPGPGRRFYVANYNSSSYSILRDTSMLGMEESRQEASSHKLQATVVRGVLFLPEAPSLKSQAANLLDATGRRMLVLHAGANDVGGLAPGVYFVRDEGRGAGDVGRTRKVILQK